MAAPPEGALARERRRGQRRRLAMGLATLLGRRRGFFIPHRYAAAIAPCDYPALEAWFANCAPVFDAVLDEIEAHGERLERLRGPAPEPRFDQSWFPGARCRRRLRADPARPPAPDRRGRLGPLDPLSRARDRRRRARDRARVHRPAAARAASRPAGTLDRGVVQQAPEALLRASSRPATCCSSTRATS